MSAYVLVEVEVENPDGYAEYRPLAAESLAKHGGRYLARDGKTEAWRASGTPGSSSWSSTAWRRPTPGTTPTSTRPPSPSATAAPRAA